MALVMGVDSSTQSTKVEVRDAGTGALVSSGRAPHPPVCPPRSEQAPAAWWAALSRAVFDADADRSGVSAISVAGQQHGLVALDHRHEVIRPAKLWNDTEAAPEAAALVDALGAANWANACGSVPLAAFTIAKVAWLARHEPDQFERLATLLLPHDWLTFHLTDRCTTDRGDASGTGYWSPAEDRWRPDLLAAAVPGRTAAEWAAMLPEVLGPIEAAGPLTDWAADQLGFKASCLIAAGTGDNMAGALGLGLAPGDLAISLGTSGTVYAVAGRPTADATGAVAGFADATGRFLPLVCTLNATQVTDTIARLLGVDHEQLDALAATEPAGAGGLVLVPYLNGERTPNRPHASGTLTGLRTDARPAQLARAAFEGVICGLLDGVDALDAAGVATGGRLFLVGGGSRSRTYRQVLADLTQREVIVPDADEAVATGACVQAAAAREQASPLDVAAAWDLGHGSITEPTAGGGRAEVREAYAAARG